MIARLTRWLDRPPLGDGEFESLAEAHVTDQAYADWARTAVRAATGEATLDEQLRALVAESDARRRGEDVRFAARLARYVGHAAPGGPILGVEEVLDRVLAPIAKQRPALLIVLDGMSHRVACELMEDVVARGWIELRPEGRVHTDTGAVALPSVTGYSRTSLLSGQFTKGTAGDEAKAFPAHAGLLAASARGGPPKLFHKGGLKDPHGGLAAELRSEIAVSAALSPRSSTPSTITSPKRPARRTVERDLHPDPALLLDEARNAGRWSCLPVITATSSITAARAATAPDTVSDSLSGRGRRRRRAARRRDPRARARRPLRARRRRGDSLQPPEAWLPRRR